MIYDFFPAPNPKIPEPKTNPKSYHRPLLLTA